MAENYQSSYTGAQIDAAIGKVNTLENNVNGLRAKDTTLEGKITALEESVQAINEAVDHYDFVESDYNGLTSNVGIVVPIDPAEIGKYKYMNVQLPNQTVDAGLIKTKITLHYSMEQYVLSVVPTYHYLLLTSTQIYDLTLQSNTSTSMIAKLAISDL